MKTYAVERIGQQIVEWYSCIMTKDIKQAKLLKPEVDIMVANMEPDDELMFGFGRRAGDAQLAVPYGMELDNVRLVELEEVK